MAPGINEMTSRVRAVDGRPEGRNQFSASSRARFRPPEGKKLCLVSDGVWATLPEAWLVFDPAPRAVRLVAAPDVFPAAFSVGKTVSTASFRETGRVKASIPDKNPQAKPRTKRNRYGLTNSKTLLRYSRIR